MVQTECVENDTQEISPAGLAESLCAPPPPRIPKLGFLFSNVGFLFQNFGCFGPGVGESGIFSLPNFNRWLPIFKTWVSSVGNLGIRDDGNFDLIFFQFQRPWTIRKRLAVLASEGTRKATQKKLVQLDYRRV